MRMVSGSGVMSDAAAEQPKLRRFLQAKLNLFFFST